MTGAPLCGIRRRSEIPGPLGMTTYVGQAARKGEESKEICLG
jgi:hypothetical protein